MSFQLDVLVECRSNIYLLPMGLIHPIRTPPLASFIDFLWYSEEYRQSHAAERILPTGAMDLVVDLAGHRSAEGSVSGAHSTSVILDTSSSLSMIGVRFKPGSGFAFFDVPAGELHNLTVSLDTLWGHDAEWLREELYRAANPQRRFLVLEKFLLRHFRPLSEHTSAVQIALRMFHNSHHYVPVARVVEQTGLNAARFIAAFRDQVGLTPKVYARITRFRRVISKIPAATRVDWTSIALNCGYFDQAHFNHDFRAFTGMTPSAYVRDRTTNPNHVRVSN